MITELGNKFYKARLNKDKKAVIDILIRALSTQTFGRNVVGCDSDSDVEAPNVFIKASLLLDGLSNKQFAYILGQMELEQKDFADAVLQIKLEGMGCYTTTLMDKAKKWLDPKPITALKKWGLIDSSTGRIPDDIIREYNKQLIQLKVKNTDEVKFKSPSEDDVNEISQEPLQPISSGSNSTPKDYIQRIYYGAPGTGKSNKVEKDTKGKIRYRTTFHPDTDYSSFVGCYKPTMNGNDIEYSFVPQVFLTAYTAAWNNSTEDVYLIIEELNRGNCAQIFGDMFQLLDREKNGYSSYVIRPDQDILRYLEKGTTVDGKEIKAINDVHRYISILKEKYPSDAEKIGKDGKIDCMALPDNLHIIATMNTSDQSLFPMDSAFKRRWDWEYIKINYSHEDLTDTTLELGQSLPWMKVLQELNNFIKNTNQSTTKQLGEWFIQPDEKNHITQQVFINKVLFYLFNDAFKDNDDFRELFGSEFYFEDFYTISEKEQSDLILEFFKKSLNIGSSNNTEANAISTQEPNTEQPEV